MLQLAHHDAIERARTRFREDEITCAVLDACSGDDWIPAKTLHRHVTKAVPNANARTIQRRTRELVSQRALRERGTTNDRAYLATGLI